LLVPAEWPHGLALSSLLGWVLSHISLSQNTGLAGKSGDVERVDRIVGRFDSSMLAATRETTHSSVMMPTHECTTSKHARCHNQEERGL
jgi:hypothetical protein